MDGSATPQGKEYRKTSRLGERVMGSLSDLLGMRCLRGTEVRLPVCSILGTPLMQCTTPRTAIHNGYNLELSKVGALHWMYRFRDSFWGTVSIMGTAEKRERIRSLMKRSVRESAYSEVLTPKLYAIFLAHVYFSRKRILSFQCVQRVL